MLKQNELIEQFNKEEQKRQRLDRKSLARRTRFPKLNERAHKALDRWDEFRERFAPADCISKKRVG